MKDEMKDFKKEILESSNGKEVIIEGETSSVKENIDNTIDNTKDYLSKIEIKQGGKIHSGSFYNFELGILPDEDFY